MTLGLNHIWSGVNVYFEHLVPEELFDHDGDKVHCFQIIPLNFTSEVPHYFKLSYSFATQLPKPLILQQKTIPLDVLGRTL